MVPSERRHGLYKVPVYELDSHLAGTVDVADALLREGETATERDLWRTLLCACRQRCAGHRRVAEDDGK